MTRGDYHRRRQLTVRRAWQALTSPAAAAGERELADLPRPAVTAVLEGLELPKKSHVDEFAGVASCVDCQRQLDRRLLELGPQMEHLAAPTWCEWCGRAREATAPTVSDERLTTVLRTLLGYVTV